MLLLESNISCKVLSTCKRLDYINTNNAYKILDTMKPMIIILIGLGYFTHVRSKIVVIIIPLQRRPQMLHYCL